MDLPFDGAISRYFENDAPEFVRHAIRSAEDHQILDGGGVAKRLGEALQLLAEGEEGRDIL